MTIHDAIRTTMADRFEVDIANDENLQDRDENLIRAIADFDVEEPDAVLALEYVIGILEQARDLAAKAKV